MIVFYQNHIIECISVIHPTTYANGFFFEVSEIGRAKLLVKENGVLAGVHEAKRIINFFDPSIEFEELLPDGAII
ncbi:MAG: hypothetical protein ACKO8Q_01305, partial [Bacteroidota bacterium]